MNAIERAKQIIEFSEKAKDSLKNQESMMSLVQWKTTSTHLGYVRLSSESAPEIAKLFLEAVEILESIGNDFYNKDGKTIKDFRRGSLEETIINDTNMAKSFVEMVKGKK